jgi:hypothetical protein
MKKFKVEQVESDMQILIEKIKDDSYQYTPEKLRHDMVTSVIGNSDKKVLVIRNLEFIETLRRAGFPAENIYYSAPSEIMKEVAICMGIPENQVNIFEYNNHTVNFNIDMTFDIIIANPPYNNGDNRKDGVLWPVFLKSAIYLLNDGGYISFLIPSSWAAVDSNFVNSRASRNSVTRIKEDILKDVTPTLIKFGDAVNSHFNVGVDISLLTAIKSKEARETLIDTGYGLVKTNIDTLPFIPVKLNDDFLQVLKKTVFNNDYFKVGLGTYTKRVKFSENTREVSNDFFRYPFVTTSAKYTNGIYGYSNSPCRCQFEEKVIWSNSGYNRPFSDNGTYGLGDHSSAILAPISLHNSLIWYLEESKLIKALSLLKKTGGHVVGYSSIIHRIPKIELIENMTDEYVYQYFQLTDSEIESIDKILQNV